MKIEPLIAVAMTMLGTGNSRVWSDEPPAATGSVAGVIRYTGEVPEVKKIVATDGTVIEHRDLIVDVKTKGLRDVVAFLENAPAQPKPSKPMAFVVDQRGMVFIPRVVAVQHGQPVRFENSDTCNHSVIANSGIKANSFNLFVNPGHPYEHTFEAEKSVITIGCSTHAWMRAWVYVFPHPWFAVSDDKGAFQIAKAPPGKYTLRLRHIDGGLQERRTIEVQKDRVTRVEIEWRRKEK